MSVAGVDRVVVPVAEFVAVRSVLLSVLPSDVPSEKKECSH